MNGTAQKANLKQYRAVGGKWKFVPVVKVNGKLDPRLVLIGGEPTSFKGGGKFYIEYRDGGKRIQKPRGVTPREALDAWCGYHTSRTPIWREELHLALHITFSAAAILEKYHASSH